MSLANPALPITFSGTSSGEASARVSDSSYTVRCIFYIAKWRMPEVALRVTGSCSWRSPGFESHPQIGRIIATQNAGIERHLFAFELRCCLCAGKLLLRFVTVIAPCVKAAFVLPMRFGRGPGQALNSGSWWEWKRSPNWDKLPRVARGRRVSVLVAWPSPFSRCFSVALSIRKLSRSPVSAANVNSGTLKPAPTRI